MSTLLSLAEGIEGTSRIYAVPGLDEGRPVVIAVGSSLTNRQEILSRFVLLLSLIVIVPATIFLRHWLGDRRAMRSQRAQGRKELPPLPRPQPRHEDPAERR